MVTFETVLKRFEQMGEKTGWTFVEIPLNLANQLKPDTRSSYRVKGQIDNVKVKQMALVPMGEGDFILAVKADLRRKLRKEEGAKVKLNLEVDTSELLVNEDFKACLEDEPQALDFFNTLTKGHQRYYSNWIESAKTVETRTKRIAQSIQGFMMGMGYPEMIRYFKGKKDRG